MKILLQSDIHIEFGQDHDYPDADFEVIVLAGDIDHSTSAVNVARWFQKNANVPVILIAGNHEFYGGDLERTLANMNDAAAQFIDIHFLENGVVVINDVRFLCCTLWTNFSLNGPDRVKQSKKIAAKYINDFRAIRLGDRALRPDDIVARFEASYAWLDQELGKPFAGKTVVVTHFAPHRAAIHPQYLDGDELTPYFTVDCSPLMRKHKIDAWLYGHTHNSVDVIVDNGTRLVSNQGGYPNEAIGYTQFDRAKIIEL